MLVKAGPIIEIIPVRSAPIRATAEVVKKVGMTVQNTAINRIHKRPVVVTIGSLSERVSA